MVKVSPLPHNSWSVELETCDQPFQFPTKGQAISFAVTWAGHHQPCEVQVFGGAGDLERQMNFPNGNYRTGPRTDRRRAQVNIPFPNRRRQDRRRLA